MTDENGRGQTPPIYVQKTSKLRVKTAIFPFFLTQMIQVRSKMQHDRWKTYFSKYIDWPHENRPKVRLDGPENWKISVFLTQMIQVQTRREILAFIVP